MYNHNKTIGVFIIPTGIGCEIGGHAGDATPSARLIASVCDTLIIHPNVVNASDINEMTDNMLYVEGSMLDRFLEGKINLCPVKSNKILLVVNPSLHAETINAAEAARVTLGIDISISVLNKPLKMNGWIENNIATGDVSGIEELISHANKYEFDALAVATEINVPNGVALNYFRNGGVNPWGGIEAIVSRKISEALNKPVAHAPVEDDKTKNDEELFEIAYNETVDPRMAPEAISSCYLVSVLKGLHKAPHIGAGINVDNIDFLVTPFGCVGRPHFACLKKNIPIIAVKENRTVLHDDIPDKFIIVENYLEAVGVVVAIKEGISLDTIRRPINKLYIENK